MRWCESVEGPLDSRPSSVINKNDITFLSTFFTIPDAMAMLTAGDFVC